MLRQAARRLLVLGEATGQRAIATSAQRLEDATAQAGVGPKEFAEAWLKKAPSTMDVPQMPSSFLKSSATGESKVNGDLFPVNFYTPHGVLADGKQVGMEGLRMGARMAHGQLLHLPPKRLQAAGIRPAGPPPPL
jgi:hypothetical protein